MTNVIVLQGSPRKQGNTKQFSSCFMDELRRIDAGGFHVEEVWLYDLEIKPCLACKRCQSVPDRMGCVQKDDMDALFHRCLEADLIVISTPIYAFFATAPVKAFLDRFIYASGKYYGPERLPPLTAGKRCAVLATAGYPGDYAVSPFSDSVKKICKHIGMEYLGTATARDFGPGQPFMTEEKEAEARAFAKLIADKCRQA